MAEAGERTSGRVAKDALAITGPTAVGKTALSLDVAERVDGEIISADSRQVYRGMDIGTAKATRAERARVPHHGLDLVDPDEPYSAGRFARDARRWIAGIRDRGRVPILVGGTGFYLRALSRPMFREPEMARDRLDRLRRYLADQPLERLRRWLRAVDPEMAEALKERGGAQRISRALEVATLSGRPLSWWQRHAPPEAPPVRVLAFVLNRPRERLYERINERVDAMAEDGLVAEVERLLEEGYGPGDPGMNATGYAELVPCLQGDSPVEEALDAIRRATRRYARRQLTWFRNQLPEDAVWLDATRPRAELVDTIEERWWTIQTET